MARRPRKIHADTVYCGTQRTVDRQFLFKPTDEIRNIVGSSAGRALAKHPVIIYWLDFNINHKQTGIAPLSDSPEDRYHFIEFNRMFNSITARETNRAHSRDGGVYSTPDRVDEAIDDPSVEQQLLYAVTNPVKDGLVDRIAHWKGASSYRQLATGEVDRYTFINRTAYHRAGGKRGKRPLEAFRESVDVQLTPIPAWAAMPPKERQALFRRRVRQLEREFREERELEGRRAMTRRAMEKVDPRDRPKNPPERSPQPLCHASTLEAAQEYAEGHRVYRDACSYASQLYLDAHRRIVAGQRPASSLEEIAQLFPRGSLKPPVLLVS